MVSYLSEPMIRAYTTGSAVLVCVSQLKAMFGVSPRQYIGVLSAVYVSMSGIKQFRYIDTDKKLTNKIRADGHISRTH